MKSSQLREARVLESNELQGTGWTASDQYAVLWSVDVVETSRHEKHDYEDFIHAAAYAMMEHCMAAPTTAVLPDREYERLVVELSHRISYSPRGMQKVTLNLSTGPVDVIVARRWPQNFEIVPEDIRLEMRRDH